MSTSGRQPEEIYVEAVPIGDIELSEFNVRSQSATKDLQELADSIEQLGLLQPVVLVGTFGEPKPKYKLIIGQRRFLAHRDILSKKDRKWSTIRAVFEKSMTHLQMKIRSLAENMHRVDLNHEEARKAVTALYTHFGKDERKVAHATGMSLVSVRRYIYVQERASQKMLRLLDDNKVTLYDVKRALDAARDNIDRAERLLDAMVGKPRRTKKRLADYAEEHPRTPIDSKMVEEASRPEVSEHLLVAMTDRIRNGLTKASTEMAMEHEDIAVLALEEWLAERGFIE